MKNSQIFLVFSAFTISLAIFYVITQNPLVKENAQELFQLGLREGFFVSPSLEKYDFTAIEYPAQYIVNSVDYNPSCGQVQKIEDILRSLSPGFFLDCGANDGAYFSNTLWLERKLGWTGLLVEADPTAWKKLLSLNRKAWLANICFSVTQETKNTTFYINPDQSAVSALTPSKTYGAKQPYQALCMPLAQVLRAFNRTTIDYFSLDVEGSELEILKTVPFDEIIFKVLVVEHQFIEGGKAILRKFMESKGYIFYRTVIKSHSPTFGCAADSIFIHPSLQLTEEQKKRIGEEDPDHFAEPRN